MSFVQYLLKADWRFYQERILGLDLYHSGYGGLTAFCLGIASLTVFALALFHLLASRKYTAGILIGLGMAAFAAGLAGAYVNFRRLPSGAGAVIREAAGALPVAPEQEAAVIALPLVAGVLVLAFDMAACLYLAVFWSASLFARGPRKSKKARTR